MDGLLKRYLQYSGCSFTSTFFICSFCCIRYCSCQHINASDAITSLRGSPAMVYLARGLPLLHGNLAREPGGQAPSLWAPLSHSRVPNHHLHICMHSRIGLGMLDQGQKEDSCHVRDILCVNRKSSTAHPMPATASRLLLSVYSKGCMLRHNLEGQPQR